MVWKAVREDMSHTSIHTFWGGRRAVSYICLFLFIGAFGCFYSKFVFVVYIHYTLTLLLLKVRNLEAQNDKHF